MNMYRDSIELEDGRKVKAKVYVMSTQLRITRTEGLREAIIVVTIPPSQRRYVPSNLTSFHWQGNYFYIEGLVVPIMALGRVDHYELTGVGRRTE